MFPGRNKLIASSSYGYTALCIGKSFIAILYCICITYMYLLERRSLLELKNYQIILFKLEK
jgi:hypothetical protein